VQSSHDSHADRRAAPSAHRAGSSRSASARIPTPRACGLMRDGAERRQRKCGRGRTTASVPIPQNDDGMRTEPGHRCRPQQSHPAATAAAPPDEPPGVIFVFTGCR
jgi:hypothetical protein